MFHDKFLRESICVLLTLCFFIIGCGGHAPNPVDRYMPGDEKRSCASLYAEIQTIENEIEKTQAAKGSRDTWNIIEFIGGILIIVPFFFMDAKGSHEAEIAALEARQKQLKIFFADQGCNVADLDTSRIEISNTDYTQLAENKQNLISATNCSECDSLLTKEDGINIYQSKRLCTNCYKKLAIN